MIHLIGFDSPLDVILGEIFPWRPRYGASEEEDSGVGVLNGRATPGNVHLVWTEGLATVEEILDAVLEIREIADLLDHPRKCDIGHVVGSVTAADVSVVPGEPTLLQRALFIVRFEGPESGGERGSMFVQSQSKMSLGVAESGYYACMANWMLG